ncbi:MAG TPA: glycosyltransferase family 2 protein [Blastocatellia bacterium]|nr:glycosyltransferase family 2 protein [Blastocatellia bacterium]
MQDHPLVYVIILNWNNFEDSKRCLESLRAATYASLEVIVVDNGSADGSGERLREQFPDLRFIFNEKNLGFARGCNVAIRAALEDERCAYVLLLNNDAVVSPHFLEKAIETAEADRRIGMVGGKIFQAPNSPVLSYAGGYVSRWRGQTVVRGFGEIDRGKFEESCEVGFIIGALLLIKREVLERVGLLPEEYFFGVEDLDYSLTVQQQGYKLYYVPQFVAYHMGGGSQSTWIPRYVYNAYRGKLILLEKHLPRGLFPLWKLLLTIYARFIASYRWHRLAKRYGYDQNRQVPYEEMEFALLQAIADHNKDALSEATLLHFDELLKQRQRSSGD